MLTTRLVGGRLALAVVTMLLTGLLAAPWSTAPMAVNAASDTPAPALAAPAPGLTLSTLAFDLDWHGVVGATQYHVQVTPYNNDGPGINVIRGAETSLSLTLPDPVFGPFILLPDMTYRWRVRASAKPTAADENDGSWGVWSEERPFRTPRLPELGMRIVDPLDGAQISPGRCGFAGATAIRRSSIGKCRSAKSPASTPAPVPGPRSCGGT